MTGQMPPQQQLVHQKHRLYEGELPALQAGEPRLLAQHKIPNLELREEGKPNAN